MADPKAHLDMIRAIKSLRPGALWAAGDDYSSLSWLPGNAQAKPTQAEVDAEVARLAALDATNTAEVTAIQTDADRTALTNALNGTLAEIDAYVRGKINADAATTTASAIACLKRVETAVVILAKQVALLTRR